MGTEGNSEEEHAESKRVSRVRTDRKAEGETDAESEAQDGVHRLERHTGRESVQRSVGSGAVATASGGTGSPPTPGTVTYDPGPDVHRLSEDYGIDFCKDGQAEQVQRMEKEFGSDRVKRWADEGMTVETMGKPRDMEAYRKRKAERSEAIPDDIERQNQASVQRNVHRAAAEGPTGEAGAPDVVRNVISKPGKSLDGDVQREMESKMGGDFSAVQVHTGPEAAAAADSINARAFTVGNHVAFNDGEYDPGSESGKKILAHELTHVRQQTDGQVSLLPEDRMAYPATNVHIQPKLEVSSPDEPAEKEAERVAESVISTESDTDQDGAKLTAATPDLSSSTVAMKRDENTQPSIRSNRRVQLQEGQSEEDSESESAIEQNMALAAMSTISGNETEWVQKITVENETEETVLDSGIVPTDWVVPDVKMKKKFDMDVWFFPKLGIEVNEASVGMEASSGSRSVDFKWGVTDGFERTLDPFGELGNNFEDWAEQVEDRRDNEIAGLEGDLAEVETPEQAQQLDDIDTRDSGRQRAARAMRRLGAAIDFDMESREDFVLAFQLGVNFLNLFSGGVADEIDDVTGLSAAIDGIVGAVWAWDLSSLGEALLEGEDLERPSLDDLYHDGYYGNIEFGFAVVTEEFFEDEEDDDDEDVDILAYDPDDDDSWWPTVGVKFFFTVDSSVSQVDFEDIDLSEDSDNAPTEEDIEDMTAQGAAEAGFGFAFNFGPITYAFEISESGETTRMTIEDRHALLAETRADALADAFADEIVTLDELEGASALEMVGYQRGINAEYRRKLTEYMNTLARTIPEGLLGEDADEYIDTGGYALHVANHNPDSIGVLRPLEFGLDNPVPENDRIEGHFTVADLYNRRFRIQAAKESLEDRENMNEVIEKINIFLEFESVDESSTAYLEHRDRVNEFHNVLGSSSYATYPNVDGFFAEVEFNSIRQLIENADMDNINRIRQEVSDVWHKFAQTLNELGDELAQVTYDDIPYWEPSQWELEDLDENSINWATSDWVRAYQSVGDVDSLRSDIEFGENVLSGVMVMLDSIFELKLFGLDSAGDHYSENMGNLTSRLPYPEFERTELDGVEFDPESGELEQPDEDDDLVIY